MSSRNRRFLPGSTAVLAWTATLALAAGAFAGPRLHQLQVLGTHNSYHIAPHPSVEALIRRQNPAHADALAYSHRPLTEQLERLAIRQVELDVFADPEGGLFADPAGIHLAATQALPPATPPDPAPLRQPGMKVLHVPDFDFLTTTPTLRDALRELRAWSDQHPAHIPLFVLLELKDSPAGPEFTQPVPWTPRLLDALEAEILEILPVSRLLRPDDVRGNRRSLREAVLAEGWPELATARGRFIFLLDNTDERRALYLDRSPTLEGRLCFVSADEDHPAAAWFKLNDPVQDFDRIRRLVRQGFLVRTRTDADTAEARTGDTRRREAALGSGAQILSTDFPEPQRSWGDYSVRFARGVTARPNPVTAPDADPDLDLEELALPGFEPFADAELRLLQQRAVGAHQQRRLAEASRDYQRLLELEPPQGWTHEQLELALQLAPRLHRVPDDPFPLRDVVVLHHPRQPLLAFHLFWEDDIDFPEDNDPADHEVVWVRYDPVSGRPIHLYAYFHGRILEAPCRDATPAFAVEWGKHGSIPMAGPGTIVEPDGLARHWRRLHEQGTRLPDHPLARHWPSRFPGTWDDYRRFDDVVETRPFLEHRRLGWTSRWANAVLDQHALAYNFAAKIEWPE